MTVNLEITVEENEKDEIEVLFLRNQHFLIFGSWVKFNFCVEFQDEKVKVRLQDVENAIQEFLFLQGGEVDQEKAQDR